MEQQLTAISREQQQLRERKLQLTADQKQLAHQQRQLQKRDGTGRLRLQEQGRALSTQAAKLRADRAAHEAKEKVLVASLAAAKQSHSRLAVQAQALEQKEREQTGLPAEWEAMAGIEPRYVRVGVAGRRRPLGALRTCRRRRARVRLAESEARPGRPPLLLLPQGVVSTRTAWTSAACSRRM